MPRVYSKNNLGFSLTYFKISSNEQSRRAHLAIIESEAEDSPESSGDEYTHDDFNTESETTTDGNFRNC